MTGKELKEFAYKLADDAMIEVHRNCAPSYHSENWHYLQPKHLRAVCVASGDVKEEEES